MSSDEKASIAIRRAARAGMALAAVALALLVGGCDKCGDWFGISRSQAQGGMVSCRDTPTQPQGQASAH